MRCVLHETRRKTSSVRETSRAVRTFGVRPVRIGFARLAHQNLLLINYLRHSRRFCLAKISAGTKCPSLPLRPRPRWPQQCAVGP